MSLAPVIVFTYNRADKAQLVLEALDQNTLASETDLYIFNDAANLNKEHDIEKVDAVRNYLNQYVKNSRFKSVKLILAPAHKGLAKSVIEGVTEIIHKYGKVIVTEDDLIAHINYLEYANEALNYYQDNSKIWSISSYGFPLEACENRTDVYFTYRGCSYGWATWSNRWDTVDWSMQDFKRLPWDLRRLHKLFLAGRDLFVMLRDQKLGRIDSWAVRWVFQQTKNELLTVYPAKTLICNIGFDGSGSHGVADGAETYDNLDAVQYNFTEVKLEKDILNQFAENYRGPWFNTIQKY